MTGPSILGITRYVVGIWPRPGDTVGRRES